MNARWLLAFGVAGTLACESGTTPLRREATKAAAAAAPPGAAPSVAPTPPPTDPNPGAAALEWRGNVAWHTWSDGLALAGKESKPIFVLVYADWCPHCRALGPVFADPEIEALAKRFVMVRQNHDDDPPWLTPYNKKYGGYVPRIFFFDSSGKLREDVTSGHPRYPYFYAAQEPAFLKKSMRRVVGS